MSHAPALLLLDLPRYAGRGAFLVFFLVVVVAVAQIGAGGGQPAAAPPPGGARDQPLVLVARLGRRRRRGGVGRRAAVLDHAVQAARRRWRWAAIAGGAGTLGEFVMKALKRDAGVRSWGGAAVGHRRGRPARPRRAAVLRGAGVLPLGALVLRRLSRAASAPLRSNGACASSASTPACAPPASACRVRRRARCATSPAARSAPTRSRSADLPARLKVIFDGVREVARALPADLRLGRDRLRQRQPAVDAAARPGARRRADGAGRRRARRSPSTPRCR